MIRLLYIALALVVATGANAQLIFTDASASLPSPTFMSWLQKGVADMNGDGLDDIVRADLNGYFFIIKQQPNGTFTEQALGQIQPRSPLSIILGDLDNNGYPDILTGGKYTGVQVLRANTDGSAYSTIRLPQDSIFVQASALSDLNNDGLLDLFVCNDDSTNAVWRNAGNGNFIRDPMGFDFTNIPANRQSGNYGIVFADINNDNHPDAYLSKCSRFAPTDSTDLRRINQLFINNGTGLFTEQAATYNLRDSSQTWVTEFQDIDNDGDLDAFIANHHSPSRLMLNDGSGHFADITASAGLLGTTPDGILQALMRDFDNDGYVDLLVSGVNEAKLYRNNGNRTFTTQTSALLNPDNNTKYLRSFAIGDLNHDGFPDIYASYYYGTTLADRLWLGQPNANHFLAVTLRGTVSNRSAVGAKIKVSLSNGQTQIREVRAGESYGISNSLTQYIGLGSNATIQKLEVRWPSGQTTQIDQPASNQFLSLIEPICQQGQCAPIEVKVLR